MDYDVVRASVQTAYNNYMENDSKFYSAMKDFYAEGKKNPSVAKIILNNHINKGMLASKELINRTASIPVADVSVMTAPMLRDFQKITYPIALATAIKSLSAQDIYNNTQDLEDDSNNYRREFDNAWREKYPRTGKLRERIIEANRISMNKINPKADWFEKINYARTLAEYQNDYPKTFFARYMLIADSQIEEGNISERVGNLLKRIVYKSLIKNKFGFKK